MMRIFSICFALMLSVTLTVDTAEAKRFGGGGSFGKMFSTPKKVAPTPKSAPSAAPAQKSATNNTAGTNAAKPKSGMGGMLGGLLAGGLLAALFMGGAFEGIQMSDILIIAAIALIAFMFLRRLRLSQPAPQYAGGNNSYPPQAEAYQPEPTAQPQAFESSSVIGGGLSEAPLVLPEWFNKDAFLGGARQHFETLQQAWNRNDLSEISTYCQPEFFNILTQERNALGQEQLDNEVVSVMAELVGFEERDAVVEVSVNFYGWMREGKDAETTEFNEIWHLTRNTQGQNADWYLVGIEQA